MVDFIFILSFTLHIDLLLPLLDDAMLRTEKFIENT